MRRALVLALLLLAACGRPLAPAERAFLANLHGTELNHRIRIHDGFRNDRRRLPKPRRVACGDLIFPPAKGPPYYGSSAGITLFNHIFIRDDWYAPDMTGGWPDSLDLAQAMLLAHEMLHAWQWQHRATTGYHPLRAAVEHIGRPDPYLFDPDTPADFAAFGYEQQGAIVEEYLCCRALAPDAERTRRLHAMLAAALPVTPLSTPLARNVRLPWDGVQVDGICG